MNVNGSNALQATLDNDEYGKPASPATVSLSYVGGLGFRNEDSLYCRRNRWYNGALGRFLSPDPIGFAGGLNLYSYVSGNPLRYVDPSGLQAGEPSDAIKSFAKMTGCCEAAKRFGLHPGAICAVLFYEYSFYNIFSYMEDLFATNADTPLLGDNETIGPFGLAPSDYARLSMDAQGGRLRHSKQISELFPWGRGLTHGNRVNQILLNPATATVYFAAVQSTRVGGKPQTSLQQADAIMSLHNPGNSWRAKMIGYTSGWNANKGSYISAFDQVCESGGCSSK